MKETLLAAAAALALAFPAHATEYRAPVSKQLFTCALSGLSRVSDPPAPQAAPCCDGQLRCAQLLSTSGILKPLRDPRT